MKKNAMLKIAAILMVAVLLTTCAISSTFAKYASSIDSIATARVAKWGVGVTTDITGLFVEEYGAAAGTAPNAKAVVADGATLGFDGIVAPGTQNSLQFTSSVTGKPEVSVLVTYALNVELVNFETGYEPIKWSLNGTDWKTAAEISDDLTASGTAIAAGTDLSTAVSDSYTLYWKWDFDTNNDGANDLKDTALGNKAAAGEEMPTVRVTLTTKITQSAAAGTPVPAQGN